MQIGPCGIPAATAPRGAIEGAKAFLLVAVDIIGKRIARLLGGGEERIKKGIITIGGGESKHFCAGADINMMRDAGAKSPEENRQDSARLDRLFNGLWWFTNCCVFLRENIGYFALGFFKGGSDS